MQTYRTADNSLTSRYAYGYDNRDVRTFVESQVGSDPMRRVNYGYDTIDQLTSERGSTARLKPATAMTP